MSKLIKYTTSRLNPNVNYRCGVVDVGLSFITNIQLWWEMLIIGKAQGVYAKISSLSLSFAVNLKLFKNSL